MSVDEGRSCIEDYELNLGCTCITSSLKHSEVAAELIN